MQPWHMPLDRRVHQRLYSVIDMKAALRHAPASLRLAPVGESGVGGFLPHFNQIPGMRRATLSVAMCTYNGELYLREQLDSIAAQTRLPDELVVCDDGSTDRTVAILDDFAASAPFPVRGLRQPDESRHAQELRARDRAHHGRGHRARRPGRRVVPAQAGAPGEGIRQVRAHRAGVLRRRRRRRPAAPAGYRLWEGLRTVERNRRLIARGRLFEALIRDDIVIGCTAAFRADYKDLVLPIGVAARLLDRVPDRGGCRHGAHRRAAARLPPACRQSERPQAIPWGKDRMARTTEHANPPQNSFGRSSGGVAPAGGLQPPRSNQDRFRPGRATSAFGGAIRHAERRTAILRETSSARRVLTASWELATLRYVRYSEGFRQCRKDVQYELRSSAMEIEARIFNTLGLAEIPPDTDGIRRHVPGWRLHLRDSIRVVLAPRKRAGESATPRRSSSCCFSHSEHASRSKGTPGRRRPALRRRQYHEDSPSCIVPTIRGIRRQERQAKGLCVATAGGDVTEWIEHQDHNNRGILDLFWSSRKNYRPGGERTDRDQMAPLASASERSADRPRAGRRRHASQPPSLGR